MFKTKNNKVSVPAEVGIKKLRIINIGIVKLLKMRRVKAKTMLLLLLLLGFISITNIITSLSYVGKDHTSSRSVVNMLVEAEVEEQFGIQTMQELVFNKDSLLFLSASSEKSTTFYNNLKDTYSIYASYLAICLEHGDPNPIVPFSWIDWYDFGISTSYKALANPTVKAKFSESQFVKATRGRNHMKSLSYNIKRLVFMCSKSPVNYVVGVSNNSTSGSSVGNSGSGIVSVLHMHGVYSSPVDIKSGVEKLRILHSKNPRLLVSRKLETRSNMYYESYDGNDMFINLHVSDFEFDSSKRVKELRYITSTVDVDPGVVEYYNNIRDVSGEGVNKTFEKFFDEVELEDDTMLEGSHYDWRFFKRVLKDKERYFAIHHLIRTWQDFANKEKIIYWLSHGNLLAWRWSGSSFLWDHDCDIQLPIKHLEYLAINFNGSMIIEDPNNGLNRYLIEISPYFTDRDNSNGKNSIDGRIIDLSTGLYIDLTAISIKNEVVSGKHKTHLADKHIHRYSFQSISPLRSTFFEGILSWVPRDTDFILTQEYPLGLVQTKYTDYEYLPNLNGWYKNPWYCLKEKTPDGVWIVPSPSSEDFCDNLTFEQLSHLLKFWNFKGVENQFICFNKPNCILPINEQALKSLSLSSNYDSLSNIRRCGLTEFTANGLRKMMVDFDIEPIPDSDMSKFI